jgi:hypothetical protein
MRRLIVGVSLAVIGCIGWGPAKACDRPGTPNQLTAAPVSPTAITLTWHNTTGKSGGGQDMWFDIAVTDGSGRPLAPSLNITGGAEGRGIKYGEISSYTFNGLAPGREYRFQMRARTASGAGGCVSQVGSNIAGAWTPTQQIDAKCAPYAQRAIQQVDRMKAHGPISPACNVISGPRWTSDKSAHYVACTEMVRNRQPDFMAGETAGRDDTINKCIPSAGQCTRDFVAWRKGNDGVPLDWCLDVMGLQKYCADHASFLATAYPKSGGRAMICVPFSKRDSAAEQVGHIARGVEEGTQDAFVAASPFLGPISEGIACTNGIIYACAVLALDVVQVTTGKQVAGIAGDAIAIATEAQKCGNGDAGACAQLGVRAAARAGLNIPGKNAAQIATAAQQCNARNNNACIELGMDTADAAGLKTK